MKIAELASKRIAIWGAGKEGLATLRLLRNRLPRLEVSMLLEDAGGAAAVNELGGEHVRVLLGAVTEERLREFEVVIKSPGVSGYRPEILAACEAGVVFTSGTNIWFAENPGARTICITGSKGKSTTSSVTAHLLRQAGLRTAAVGNIGVPLVDLLLEPAPFDVYVVELSSYQLHDFTGQPEVAVLVNLFPEHLDWHKGAEAYFRDKCRLLHAAGDGRCVVNHTDPNTMAHVPPRLVARYFNVPDGYHLRDGDIYRADERVANRSDMPLLGEHNLSNIGAALTALEVFGVKDAARLAVEGLKSFRPLPHRLTVVGEKDGRLYVDDSISTIPQAAIAAIRAVGNRPVTILVGGHDRGLDQNEFARLLLGQRVHGIIAMPNTGQALHAALMEQLAITGGIPQLHLAKDLAEAVGFATRITPPGGVVLLSPGAPSYNCFKNFEERGFAFGELAGFADYRAHR